MNERTRVPILEHLAPLEGEWEIEGSHRLMPGEIFRGRATFEWLEGGHFLIWRTHYDHPAIPGSIAIIGHEDPEEPGVASVDCTMRYFDVRGVTRRFVVTAEPGVWRHQRDFPGFSQRFTGRFSDDGRTVHGVAELCQDGVTWMEDLKSVYRRVR